MMPTDDSEALQIGPDPDKLYLYHRQQLSAMLDGELSPDQARFMLRRLQHDAELASCWERWQVCGDVLRGQRNALLPADFAQHVARAIAGGDAAPVPAAAGRTRLWRWGGGAALAASVAMAALFVAREPLRAPGESSGTPMPTIAAVPAPAAADQENAEDAGALESGLALAGAAAVAAAEVPRRNDERRSRGQSQRAATTREQRRAERAPVAVAAAARNPQPSPSPDFRVLPAPPAAGGPAAVAAADIESAAIDPFALTPALPSRPWPRAVAPELSGRGAFTVGYGELGAGTASFHPFEPRMASGQAASSMPDTAFPPATAIGASATPVDEADIVPADPR